jgi:putative SOS response-associated peptidase YedK
MCGRYTFFMLDANLEERFGATPREPLKAHYNAAPSQDLPVIRNDSPTEITHLRWGLIPRWADDESTEFINARAETLREKRSFAEPFEQRRCLVLADGFYEWAEPETGKRPFRVTLEEGEPFCIAGLWERWAPTETQSDLGAFADADAGIDGGSENEGGGRSGGEAGVDADADPIETFTILTTEPNDVVGELHHRMPVVLPRESERRWLEDNAENLDDLLSPYAGNMDAYPVSRAVNDPSNDVPELITEADTEAGAG